MKTSVTISAILFAIGGLAPALIAAAAFGAAYAVRSPDRLLDAVYIAAFCGLGYLVG